jgi:hypothetical protein
MSTHHYIFYAETKAVSVRQLTVLNSFLRYEVLNHPQNWVQYLGQIQYILDLDTQHIND